jgi:succinylglutamate desuccinylase
MVTVETAIKPPKSIAEGEHLIGKFIGDKCGATLIVVGSVHGNEPSGWLALRRISRQLENLREKLRGRVYLLAGNTRALGLGIRFADADLNRHWTPGNIIKSKSNFPLKIVEDSEQRELMRFFDEVLQTAQAEVFALDLHTTSAMGAAFATVGDTIRNRSFAQKFPVTILLGIEEQLDGTMLEYLNNEGAVTLGFEGGQHDSSEAIENHEAIVWLALVNAGVLAAEDAPDLERQRQILARATGAGRIVEVRHREAVAPDDDFQMNEGFENFDEVKRGQVLARNRRGAIKAGESGLILMPLYQKQGNDGFFIGREIAPFWLWLSGILRNRKIADLMRFLPGVVRHPINAETFVVNTQVARFFPLQIFHLLGFRKRRWQENKLVVCRRRHDTRSPFKRRGR